MLKLLEITENIFQILGANRVEESVCEKYPFLKESNFLVEESVDEKKVADIKYNELVYSNNC